MLSVNFIKEVYSIVHILGAYTQFVSSHYFKGFFVIVRYYTIEFSNQILYYRVFEPDTIEPDWKK